MTIYITGDGVQFVSDDTFLLILPEFVLVYWVLVAHCPKLG